MSSPAVTNTTAIAIEIESVEGTYVAPAGASSYVQTLPGVEMKNSKELIEREVFSGTIGQITPRTGTRSSSGTLGTELRAFSTEGSAPENDKLLKSALGTRRQNTTNVTTKSSGNTASVLQIDDADISKFNIGDIVLVKMSGAYHVSPISAKSTGTGTATITLLIPHPSGDIDDSVVVGKFTTYTVAESGHPTLSITKYLDSAVEQQAFGCRVNKVDISDFATGKIPKLSFGFDGLNFDKSLTVPSYSPSYDSALPPIALDAKMYMDTTAIQINELSLSIENTVSFQTTFSSSNGKVASRVTKRKITGSIDPYQLTDSVSNYTKFVNGTEFSLFAYAKNDSGTTGQFQNIVAVYMPKCIITEEAEADADGLVQSKLSFTASRGTSGTTNEIYLVFI
jgi:hypothetical protein